METLIIENTTFCQADCIVCVRDCLKFKQNNMPQDLFEKSIDEVYALCKKNGSLLRFIDFGGMGEPLLDSNLEKKLKYLEEHYPEIKIGLTTNAQLLMVKKDILCRYVDILKISNYGFTKKSFESVHRGSLIYEDIRKNIEDFLSVPLKERPKVTMSFLMLPENAGEENDWRAYWEEKCEEVFIWRPHNWAGYKSSHTQMENGKAKSCGRPGKDFVVRANGDVSVCCWDFNREMSIGNLCADSFEDIYNGVKLAQIMDMHNKKSFFETDNPCARCDQLYDRADALIYSSARNFKVGNRLTADSELLNK